MLRSGELPHIMSPPWHPYTFDDPLSFDGQWESFKPSLFNRNPKRVLPIEKQGVSTYQSLTDEWDDLCTIAMIFGYFLLLEVSYLF